MNTPVQRQQLYCHPNTPCEHISSVGVSVQRQSATWVCLDYVLTGEQSAIRIPEILPASRCNDLWQHTCAEAFITAPDEESYCEFNFAPSTQWAAYEFTGYRQDMRVLACNAPLISITQASQSLIIKVILELPQRFMTLVSLQMGLSMVIEDCTGHRSYWALSHEAARPDFHQRGSMVLLI